MAKIWIPLDSDVSVENIKEIIMEMNEVVLNAENRKTSAINVINELQNLCKHKYKNGKSAIVSTAFASPYDLKRCEICGKVFGDE